MITTVTAEVLFGINTIYTVRAGDVELTCRIKGKQLRDIDRAYNPIAPGDVVEVTPVGPGSREGMIARLLRGRWRKRKREEEK